ncbi:phosphatidylserine decarboxylase [Rubeoparvulum massiliense]|uniref:phosphatidylserine decarboxylase n=1 Tax=Rubeoparvulum massiliense TaxID=1631346 RepID=UPI00065E13DD|nr:phosphatidylserine decarboxylase [Rubeoparvulum massiliense]
MKRHALLKEGIPTLLVILVLGIILFIIQPWLSLIAIGLLLFVLYFFRDPARNPEEIEGVVISAADGVVTDIQEIEDPEFMEGKATCISIFLSPLDVHVNRSPVQGEIVYQKYVKGRFISATKPESHQVNEKNYIGIESAYGKIMVVQIAGMMARRIVSWVTPVQSVHTADKIGMIKFGSGTQIWVNQNVEVVISVGDRVRSGKTVIGRVKSRD